MTALNNVKAVIVHHRRFVDLLETVQGVIDAGIPAHNVVVVDTSEQGKVTELLAQRAHGWAFFCVPNDGFGAAANRGVAARPHDLPFTLVLTHETRFAAADLMGMVDVLEQHNDVGAVGPDILMAGEAIWSRGGTLSKRLLLPRHRVDSMPSRIEESDVAWLDGAITLYRTELLRNLPFREDFFLYLEETELHTRLRRNGWRVATAKGTLAHQSSGGMPAFWGVRNTFLFQQAHGTRYSKLVTPWYVLLRTTTFLATRGRWREIRDAVRGFVAGWTAAKPFTRHQVPPDHDRGR